MSSQLSFQTAVEMQSSPLSNLPTSSPINSSPAPALDALNRRSYRSARELPYELREHCLIYFEEELYTQALTLLLNLITAPPTNSSCQPVFTPSPHHLSLACTLAIHPSLTTRAPSRDRLHSSFLALKLLRVTTSILGPVNANLSDAFIFSSSSHHTRGHRADGNRRRRRTGNLHRTITAEVFTAREGDSDEKDSEEINSSLATTASIFHLAEDFWRIVGWAFNCACSLQGQARWRFWQGWLDMMVGILEDDWRERTRLAESLNVGTKAEARNQIVDEDEDDDEVEEGPLKQAKVEIFSESLVVKWLPDGRNRNSGGECRRVLRAVFADGGDEAMREFQEVWIGETRERHTKHGSGVSAGSNSMKRKREAGNVNIEQDAFGDYCDVDEDDDDCDLSEDNKPQPSPQILYRSTPNVMAFGSDAGRLGGTRVLQLRARLLALLSSVAHTIPALFLPVPTLYDLLTPPLLALPAPYLSLILSPTLFTPIPICFSLSQTLLLSLLTPSAPASPFSRGVDHLDQEVMETCYLPFYAATGGVHHETRVSILLETLLRGLAMEVGLQSSADRGRGLADAVQTGVDARNERVERERQRRRKGLKGASRMMNTSEEEFEEGRRWLVGSGKRMRAIIRLCVNEGPLRSGE